MRISIILRWLSVTEYLTYPYRQNDRKLIYDFYSFVQGMEINIKSIDQRIAEKAAKIRGDYKFFPSFVICTR